MLMFNGSLAFAQQNMNVCGNSAKIGENYFDYSIGEMTLVNTLRNSTMILTQGFLQPDYLSIHPGNQLLPQSNHPLSDDALKVYPNPTDQMLYLESVNQEDLQIRYQLLNAAGSMIVDSKASWKKGRNRLSLDLQSISAGYYFLKVRQIYSAGYTEEFAFKIYKKS